jgi:thiol-disulfide isomerase/thioredoxin
MRWVIAVLLVVVPGTLLSQSAPPNGYQAEANAWFKIHALPKDATPAEREAFQRQLVEAASEWAKRWPDDLHAQLRLLGELSRVKSASDAQLEEAGDAVLRVSREHPYKGFRFVPIEKDVIMAWDSRNIRLEQCLALAQQAVAEDEQAQRDNPSAARQYLTVVAQGFFEILSVELDVARKLKKPDVETSAIGQMKQWLDEHPKEGAPFEHWYLEAAATKAEAEDHKHDALMYYLRDVREFQQAPGLEAHVAALWKELGGTEGGFKEWTTNTLAQKDAATGAETEKPSRWAPINKPVEAFQGTDLHGRTWTAADLRGRTTLVNVWATWCYPCQMELPMVQKIFDRFKGRADVQVVTVSIDEDRAWVGKFLAKVPYSFPVILMSSESIDKMAGVTGLPRTWIVDPRGMIRFEMAGYDAADWPDPVLQQLAIVK